MLFVCVGSIPLRQLVYRVLALPASMQPLVYDFGQLTDNTEEAYTMQIVKDRVSVPCGYSGTCDGFLCQ